MGNKIQILRNGTISTTRDAAVAALKTKLATLSDGEIAINRYEVSDSNQVKVILGFNNTVGSDGATKQFIFDADAIPADVQTELEKITGDTGTIAKLKEEIIGKETDSKDANTVYGAKAYAKDYADTKVESLDVTDTVTKGSVVVAVSENGGKVSSTKATITSSDKTVNVSSDDDGNITLAANIDGNTIVKNASTGVLSVASSALTQYVGSNAIAVSNADESNNKTIRLTIKSGNTVLSQDANGLTTTLSIAYDSTNRKVQLKGIGSAVVSEFDATAFVKDGILNDAKVFTATATSQTITFDGGDYKFEGLTVGNHYIGFEFATKGGEKDEYSYDILDATDIIDVYTAGDGLALDDHKFSVKKDSSSEDFLSVSESGVKVSGVQAAINKANSVVVNKDKDAHVKVTSSTDATDDHTIYTVESVDTASANDLANEVIRAAAAEGKIEASVGLAEDGSHVTTTGNYTSKATTIAGEIAALDTQVKKNEDALIVLNGADTVTGSVAKSIKDAVEALDVDEVGGEGKVITTISEADGKISATAIELKAANVAATATVATDDKVAVTGATVEAQIASLAKSIATIDCGTY